MLARSHSAVPLACTSSMPVTISPIRSESRRTVRTRCLDRALTCRCSFGITYICTG